MKRLTYSSKGGLLKIRLFVTLKVSEKSYEDTKILCNKKVNIFPDISSLDKPNLESKIDILLIINFGSLMVPTSAKSL